MRFEIHDGRGDVAFTITEDGYCVRGGFEIDPRATYEDFGVELETLSIEMELIRRRRGLNGETIEYYRVGGSDVVRFVDCKSSYQKEWNRRPWWELWATWEDFINV